MSREQPSFSLVTICPTFVFGPVIQPLSSIDKLNTSSQRIYDFIAGNYTQAIPDTGISFFLWIDVRDLATAHVNAMEFPNITNRRYLLTEGYFCNREIYEIIKKRFPEYEEQLPVDDGQSGGFPPEGIYRFDNNNATNELGLSYRSLESSVVDTVQSIQQLQQRVGS